MSAAALIQEIGALGGRLELDGDDIRLIKPKGVWCRRVCLRQPGCESGNPKSPIWTETGMHRCGRVR